jgi:hypothetical protein
MPTEDLPDTVGTEQPTAVLSQRVDQLNQVLDHDGFACSPHEKRLHSHRKKSFVFSCFAPEQHSRSRKAATPADGLLLRFWFFLDEHDKTTLWTFFARSHETYASLDRLVPFNFKAATQTQDH